MASTRAKRAIPMGGARGGKVSFPLRRSDVEEAGNRDSGAGGADDDADQHEKHRGAEHFASRHGELPQQIEVTGVADGTERGAAAGVDDTHGDDGAEEALE